MREGWFTETLYPDFQQRLQISEILFETRTEFQHLMIFKKERG